MLNHKCDKYDGQLCTNRATKCIIVRKKIRHWLFFFKYIFWDMYWHCDEHHDEQLEFIQEEFYDPRYKFEIQDIRTSNRNVD